MQVCDCEANCIQQHELTSSACQGSSDDMARAQDGSWQTTTQSQGSVERANRDIEASLACWMKDNNFTQWSQGLRFVQWKKNTRFHSGIGRTPYEAMYGQKARLGVDATSVPEEVLDGMQTEEQLAEALGVVNEVTDTEEEETGVEEQEEPSAVIN
ncbi:KRAB-A domain-containing protein 2-like [Macrobrachium nipponense]|uniref:KRAB-A domain-containing protein 2-like n=1 Tax=Macrobrachium nipponense TaxID=159736 RepID=UPI0030C80891